MMGIVTTLSSRIKSQKSGWALKKYRIFIFHNSVCRFRVMPVTFIKIIWSLGESILGRTERYFLKKFGKGKTEQINNSTEGILMFQNIGHAIYESFRYAKCFARINLSTPPNSLRRMVGLLSPIHRFRKGCVHSSKWPAWDSKLG